MTSPIRSSEATLIEVRQALQRIEMNRRTGVKNNLTATSDPAVTDDETQGYSAGSWWFNTTGDILSYCTDATAGAAVWVNIFGAGGGGGEVAGTGHNFGVIEPPDANTLTATAKGDTLTVTATGDVTITGDPGTNTLNIDAPLRGEQHFTLLAPGAGLVI